MINLGYRVPVRDLQLPGGSDRFCHHCGKHWLHDHQHGSSQVIVFATILGNIGSMITNMGAAN
jgi:hypothetical protein